MATQVLTTSCMQQQMDPAPGQHARFMAKPIPSSGRVTRTSGRQPGFAVRSLNFETANSSPGVHTWKSPAASSATKKPTASFSMSPSSSSSSSSNRFSTHSAPSPQANTPDSGISGTAFGSMPKTPESDYSLSTLSPPSALSTSSSFSGVGGGICGGAAAGVHGGSSGGSSQRKRKTVTIDESQTSIVMISPDDLFRTYSGMISSFADRQDQSGAGDFSWRNDEDRENGVEEEDFYTEYKSYGDERHWEGTEPGDELDENNVIYGLDGQVSEVLVGPGGDHIPLAEGHHHHGRFVLDTETGWPLKRSESLESRDNPFLPGGELSKEAEDLLSRATIIRDNFYLNEEEKRVLLEQQRQEEEKLQQEQQQQKKSAKHVQIVAHQDGDVTTGQPQAVEERVCVAASANSVSAVPTTSNGDGGAHLENGRRTGEPGAPSTGTSDVSVTIPGNDGTAQASSTSPADGPGGFSSQSGPGPDGLSVQDSDKKKPRNKCCSVM